VKLLRRVSSLSDRALSSQPARAGDFWPNRIVLGSLSLITITCVGGTIVLQLQGLAIPDLLTIVAENSSRGLAAAGCIQLAGGSAWYPLNSKKGPMH
jgi:hypothetical protein